MAWSTTAVAGIWVTCIAALFLAVGFAIPFWFGTSSGELADKKTYHTYVGVWYLLTCEKGQANSCKTKAIEPKFETNTTKLSGSPTADSFNQYFIFYFGHYVYWWAIQICTSIGLGLVLLATLILICCRCAGIHSKGFFVISAILLFFGGTVSLAISILAAVIVGTDVAAVIAGTDIPFRTTVNGETFPWSILIFGIGGLLALVASVIIMVVTCKWSRLGEYFESDTESLADNGQQMSNISKTHSYDRPRKYENRGYEEPRYDHSRDFSSSKKYRDGRDYSRYDRAQYPEKSYDNGYDRGYDDKGYIPTGSYEAYSTSNGYSKTRSGDTLYRPYNQPYSQYKY